MNTNIYLKPDEARFLSIAVVDCIEMIQTVNNDPTVPWTPESRRINREMIAAGKSLRLKLEKNGFDMRPLPDYKPGDEDEFLTKQS